MSGVSSITSRSVALPIANIDTDQIIPARFLTTTSRAGLGRHAFQDWRWREDGSANPDFALNRPEHAGAAILIAGDNFGCGSSREHLSLIHISEPTRLLSISYAVFCLKKKKNKKK